MSKEPFSPINKEARLQVRLLLKELKELKAASRALDMGISEFVRQTLRARYRHDQNQM